MPSCPHGMASPRWCRLCRPEEANVDRDTLCPMCGHHIPENGSTFRLNGQGDGDSWVCEGCFRWFGRLANV